MKLDDVIEGLVEDKGLDRDKVISVVCEGVLAAFSKKFPLLNFSVVFNKKTRQPEAFVKKVVVSSVKNEDLEISLRKAKRLSGKAKDGGIVEVPFEDKIGRVEILVARQVIASKIRELENSAVFDEFKEKEGSVVSGVLHKRERDGFVVQVEEVMAFLPLGGVVAGETLKVGGPVRALLKHVLESPRGDFQLILDRASFVFVKKLFELEIPEIFEKVVEIKKIVRIPGYKTKVAVVSTSKDIDPVGTCVGVEGVRIKPILRELGGEKIDVIEWKSSLEEFVKSALKPAEIDKVEMLDNKRAMVWLAKDQRSLAIGRMGRNILLASKLVGVDIDLQQLAPEGELGGLAKEDPEESPEEGVASED